MKRPASPPIDYPRAGKRQRFESVDDIASLVGSGDGRFGDLRVEILAVALTLPSSCGEWVDGGTALALKSVNSQWWAAWPLALERVFGTRYRAIIQRLRALCAAKLDETMVHALVAEVTRDTMHADQRAFIHWLRRAIPHDDGRRELAPVKRDVYRPCWLQETLDGRTQYPTYSWKRHVWGIRTWMGPKPLIAAVFKILDCNTVNNWGLMPLLVCNIPPEPMAALLMLYYRHMYCHAELNDNRDVVHAMLCHALLSMVRGLASVDVDNTWWPDERHPWLMHYVDMLSPRVYRPWYVEKGQYLEPS